MNMTSNALKRVEEDIAERIEGRVEDACIIIWLDSCTYREAYMRDELERLESPVVYTIGFLLEETERDYKLATFYYTQDLRKDFKDVHIIPKNSVIKIINLAEIKPS